MPKTSSDFIKHTQAWLQHTVIGYNFCPYAKQPDEQDRIAYKVFSGDEILSLLEQLVASCIELDSQPTESLETTLLIIAGNPSGYLSDYFDYLSALDIANTLLETPQEFAQHFSANFIEQHLHKLPLSWAEKYQLASFHPDYQFENTTDDDRENYTNKSPYPIFHIIRNDSIEAVRMNNKRANLIVSRNIETLTQLSDTDFQQLKKLTQPD